MADAPPPPPASAAAAAAAAASPPSPAPAPAAAPSPLSPLEALVAAVYAIKLGYFGADKPARLQAAVARAARAAAALKPRAAAGPGALRAALALLHGRALDALPAYSPEAEVLLARAVKLEPGSAAAWAALGHVFWKKRDLAQAASCFEESAARAPSAAALRALSSIARQAPAASAADHARSLARAREAVALDVAEAANWATLGTALLVSFFARTKDAEDLAKASKAFARAAQLEGAALAAAAQAQAREGALKAPAAAGATDGRGNAAATATAAAAGAWASPIDDDDDDPLAPPSPAPARPPFSDPDLHFNRAQVLQYLGDFSAAQAAYAAAHAVDPFLEADAAARSMRAAFARVARAAAAAASAAASSCAARAKALLARARSSASLVRAKKVTSSAVPSAAQLAASAMSSATASLARASERARLSAEAGWPWRARLLSARSAAAEGARAALSSKQLAACAWSRFFQKTWPSAAHAAAESGSSFTARASSASASGA